MERLAKPVVEPLIGFQDNLDAQPGSGYSRAVFARGGAEYLEPEVQQQRPRPRPREIVLDEDPVDYRRGKEAEIPVVAKQPHRERDLLSARLRPQEFEQVVDVFNPAAKAQ